MANTDCSLPAQRTSSLMTICTVRSDTQAVDMGSRVTPACSSLSQNCPKIPGLQGSPDPFQRRLTQFHGMQGVRSSSLLGSMSETPLQEGFFSVWKSDRQGPSDGRGRIFGRTFQPPAPQARFGRRSTANHPGAPLTRQARNAHLHSEARGRKPGDAARPIRSATRPCKSPESWSGTRAQQAPESPPGATGAQSPEASTPRPRLTPTTKAARNKGRLLRIKKAPDPDCSRNKPGQN